MAGGMNDKPESMTVGGHSRGDVGPAPDGQTACACCVREVESHSLASPVAAQRMQAVLRIDQMCCPTEEGLIRSKLSGLPGVTGLEFDLLQRRLTLSHDA